MPLSCCLLPFMSCTEALSYFRGLSLQRDFSDHSVSVRISLSAYLYTEFSIPNMQAEDTSSLEVASCGLVLVPRICAKHCLAQRPIPQLLHKLCQYLAALLCHPLQGPILWHILRASQSLYDKSFLGRPHPTSQPYPQVPDLLIACLHAVLSCSSLTRAKHPPLLPIRLFKPFPSPSCCLGLPQLTYACTGIGVQMWLHQKRECLCHCALSSEGTLHHGSGKTVGFRVRQSDLES